MRMNVEERNQWAAVAQAAECRVKERLGRCPRNCGECRGEEGGPREWVGCGECAGHFHKRCLGLTDKMAVSGFIYQCTGCALDELRVVDSDARAAAAGRHKKGLLAEQSRVQESTAANYSSYISARERR